MKSKVASRIMAKIPKQAKLALDIYFQLERLYWLDEIKESFKILTKEELEANRSSVYKYIL